MPKILVTRVVSWLKDSGSEGDCVLYIPDGCGIVTPGDVSNITLVLWTLVNANMRFDRTVSAGENWIPILSPHSDILIDRRRDGGDPLPNNFLLISSLRGLRTWKRSGK